MRLYRHFSTWSAAGVRTAVNPTAFAAATSTVAGVPIENLVPVNDGAVGRYRADTTDALYAGGTAYLVAWTATIAGVGAFTRTVRYRHVTAATADVTGPGVPVIGDPSVTDSTATFPHVPPTDADYATTVIYITDGSGTVVATGAGSGATITVIGLSAGVIYNATAIAFDANGNSSVPSIGDEWPPVRFTTAVSAMPDVPLVVKWWVNDGTTVHPYGPVYLDATRSGSHQIGCPPAPMGRGGMLSFRLGCHHPRWLSVRQIILRAFTPTALPGGLDTRTRSDG